MSREPCVSALFGDFGNARFARTTVSNTARLARRKTRTAGMAGVWRTGTFSAKTNARERKNERSSSAIERDAVEKRRHDATRAR